MPEAHARHCDLQHAIANFVDPLGHAPPTLYEFLNLDLAKPPFSKAPSSTESQQAGDDIKVAILTAIQKRRSTRDLSKRFEASEASSDHTSEGESAHNFNHKEQGIPEQKRRQKQQQWHPIYTPTEAHELSLVAAAAQVLLDPSLRNFSNDKFMRPLGWVPQGEIDNENGGGIFMGGFSPWTHSKTGNMAGGSAVMHRSEWLSKVCDE